MAGLINSAMADWREVFKERTGHDASALGIETEAAAQRHLLAVESMRTATTGPGAKAAERDYGKVGMDNEGIRPTR